MRNEHRTEAMAPIQNPQHSRSRPDEGLVMSDEISLPPMLRPVWREVRPTNPPKVAAEWFSREQMAEYAKLAVLADREARG